MSRNEGTSHEIEVTARDEIARVVSMLDDGCQATLEFASGSIAKSVRRGRLVGWLAICSLFLSSALATAAEGRSAAKRTAASSGMGAATSVHTLSPIKHVIVIVGENHTFDNVFATYRPSKGQTVRNLLSERIVAVSGAPGANARKARQRMASDTESDGYEVSPKRTGIYGSLPRPNTTSVSKACDGLAVNVPDTRFPSNLANAPYQITKYVPYFDNHADDKQYGTCELEGAFVGDPIHRFYQMYQEVSGGRNDLWTWVHETAGASGGAPAPSPFTDQSTRQGALDMGFYNMARGDAPTLKLFARRYAMSDNYHQAMMGGSAVNHIILGTGDDAFYQGARGKATPPPAGEIEDPNAQPGTNNFYSQDGNRIGGNYSDCAVHSAPGVHGVFRYLDALPYKVANVCGPGHYYLLNNKDPGYNVDGSLNTSASAVPPQHSFPTVGGELSARRISWGYFGEGYDHGAPGPEYCRFCDPMQYSSAIMTNPAKRKHVQHGLDDFDIEATNGNLPAVSFLKPGADDGHPASSTLAAFEAFVKHAVHEVRKNKSLWRRTAIFVTFDEGGGYYDSGYIQPISFFGDGTRVPMIVISPYAKRGYISHTYTDSVSILKFIERNWGLQPLSHRSLDNLPNPKTKHGHPYIPTNRPAIGSMFDMFKFHRKRKPPR